MKTIGQQTGKSRRVIYGWKDASGKWVLSSMKEPMTVHGNTHRPVKIFQSKEAAEAEAAQRKATVEWSV